MYGFLAKGGLPGIDEHKYLKWFTNNLGNSVNLIYVAKKRVPQCSTTDFLLCLK